MIFILTEAGGTSGFGHLTRCLSLYDECVSRGFETKLVINSFSQLPESIGKRSVELFNWLDLTYLRGLLSADDFAIVDSYLAPYEVYEFISGICKKVVFIDDYMRISYPESIVVCPALYGDKLPYPEIPGVCYCGGSGYIILRSEFLEPAENPVCHKPPGSEPTRIIITMGGTDIFGLTAPVLAAISKQFPDSQKSVILGSNHFDKKAVEKAADKNTEILVSLDAKQMRDIMIRADFAITTAGQTIHELLRYGIPMIPILVADNQRLNIQGLGNLGFSFINALDEIFDPSAFDWKSLVTGTPRLPEMNFEGHKNVVNLLLC